MLRTFLSGATYLEVGALGLADVARSRKGLEASARALKASVLTSLPEGLDPEEAGLSEDDKRERLEYIRVR